MIFSVKSPFLWAPISKYPKPRIVHSSLMLCVRNGLRCNYLKIVLSQTFSSQVWRHWCVSSLRKCLWLAVVLYHPLSLSHTRLNASGIELSGERCSCYCSQKAHRSLAVIPENPSGLREAAVTPPLMVKRSPSTHWYSSDTDTHNLPWETERCGEETRTGAYLGPSCCSC